MSSRTHATKRHAQCVRFDPTWFAPCTIGDLRRKVFARLRNGWPGKSLDDLEDATSDGVLQLIDKWPEYSSTKKAVAEGDAAKLFAYACKFAYRRALDRFEQERDRNIRNPVVAIVETADEPMAHRGTVWGERMSPLRDEFSDEEREGRMLARLLAKHGTEGLRERAESLKG